MKHLAPIRMFGPGKGDFKSTDPGDRDFRTEVEKIDDDDPENQDPTGENTDDETNKLEGSQDGSEGTEGSKPAVPKD